GCSPNTSAPEITAATPEDEAAQRELSSLARALHNATPGAYEKLAAFAGKNAGNVWGARASLALGYDDYNKNHSQQALVWLAKAKSDTLLGDYVLYWTAQTQRVLKQNAPAFAELQTIQTEYPNTGIKEQFLEAYAPSALEAGKPQAAIEALEAYTGTTAKPALLLLRAQAYKQARQFGRAAKDYQLLYYKNPLSDEGKTAASGLQQVKAAMGREYPEPSWELQEGRAQILFNQKKYRDAQIEFTKLAAAIKDPSSAHKQHALLRAAQTRVQLKAAPSLVSSLAITDPEVDAERMYVVAQISRSANKESDMLAGTEAVVQKYPQSKWSEEALMMAGNYYWVQLNRHEAIKYYQRVVDNFPSGKYTFFCEWRTAWIAYLDRQPYADDRLTAFLRKYPTSANAPDALYWLGRNAERGGNPGHARAYFQTAVNRWPQTYFGHASAARLEKLGTGDQDAPDFLAAIPPAPALRSVDEPIPEAAKDRWVRAQALRIIAFDASAELELKSGFFATGSPRLLLEAAQCAFDQGHFATGMSYGRLIVPSFDSRKISDVPPNVWKTIFPLPYEASLRREAARNEFDPMLAAGLIRQESTFQADIVSHANAVGLMQVLPKTGKLLAKQLKVRYTKAKLFDPEYNLELGMLYIAGLLKLTGEPEYALAAFNAGEDRIAAWRAERNYEEISELVESIPFTETRDYVQIVMRNADVYRQVYGPGAPPSTATSTATTTPAPAPASVAPAQTAQPEPPASTSADSASDPNL
ncbi:MAG TPA: transglycosylase SLT domain-containing protein, partial [Candidatus Acidoferrum sp.]|nr:transglycosylase SLT domain-containing protein [Candidatus Acidoferrum sp.]